VSGACLLWSGEISTLSDTCFLGAYTCFCLLNGISFGSATFAGPAGVPNTQTGRRADMGGNRLQKDVPWSCPTWGVRPSGGMLSGQQSAHCDSWWLCAIQIVLLTYLQEEHSVWENYMYPETVCLRIKCNRSRNLVLRRWCCRSLTALMASLMHAWCSLTVHITPALTAQQHRLYLHATLDLRVGPIHGTKFIMLVRKHYKQWHA